MCQFKSPSCFGVVAQKGKFCRLLLISDGGPLSQANLRHLVLEKLVSSSQLASAPIVICARDAVMVRNRLDWGGAVPDMIGYCMIAVNYTGFT